MENVRMTGRKGKNSMALRSLFLVAFASLSLAGCGGNRDRDAIIQAFSDAGMEPETGECVADKAKDDMDPKLYDALVEAAKSNDDSLDTLSTEQQEEFGKFMFEAALSCVPLELQ
ncbi:MAG: hypothetical protein MRY64_12915 [Hyphomonadaceae bacterium]|nr:hypothetical protein [Hyphomonadaceae bacterium]